MTPRCATCDGAGYVYRWCFGAGRFRLFEQGTNTDPIADCGKFKAHGPHRFVAPCADCASERLEARGRRPTA